VAGLVVVKDPELAERVYFLQNSVGAVLGPQDSWLVMRGMKTLGVRLDRQQENALRIAEWLQEHPKVKRVFYPGLSGHLGHDVLKDAMVWRDDIIRINQAVPGGKIASDS
jgi:cystathionine gamma-synthase/cystathionine beta-lyase